MIDVDNLTFRYKRNAPDILKKVSFKLPKGEILAVLGRNGIGKTTLLKCLTSEILNYSGDIYIKGKNLKEYSIHDRSKVIALVSANNPCYQNLKVADFLATGFANQLASLQVPGKHQYEKAYQVLQSMGKEELFNASIMELSSGEVQLVKIARAILQNPEIIIFDEPTSNLDIANQLVVLNQITQLADNGYTVITTTHNPGQAMELNGMVLMMSSQYHVYGKSADVLTEKNLSEIYGLKISLEDGISRKYAVCTDSIGKHQLVY